MKSPKSLRDGFTLVEVLVVLVIVVSLAVISFYMWERIKRSAIEATIVSNMRQMGVGILSRVSEEGRFFHRRDDPRWDRWTFPSLGYTDELPEGREALTRENAPSLQGLADMFVAPDDQTTPEDGAYKCSYGVAAWLSNANGYPFGRDTADMGLAMARINKPSEWFMMYQNYLPTNLLGKGFNAYSQPGTGVETKTKFIVFVDGHVENFPTDLPWSEFREKHEPGRDD